MFIMRFTERAYVAYSAEDVKSGRRLLSAWKAHHRPVVLAAIVLTRPTMKASSPVPPKKT